jgi:hypothetical protein
MEKMTMKTIIALLLATTAAHAEFTLRKDPTPVNGDRYQECAVVRVSPPDHDRNPGYKVTLHLTYDDGKVTSFGIVHTLADGTTRDRSEQYSGDKLRWWPDGSAQWTGWRGHNYMTGDYYVSGRYTEVIRSGGSTGRVEVTIDTRCHES